MREASARGKYQYDLTIRRWEGGDGVRISLGVFTPLECRTQIAACPRQGLLTLLTVIGRPYSERWQALFERHRVATKYHDQDDRRAKALLLPSKFQIINGLGHDHSTGQEKQNNQCKIIRNFISHLLEYTNINTKSRKLKSVESNPTN
jgi:hypothetical protein